MSGRGVGVVAAVVAAVVVEAVVVSSVVVTFSEMINLHCLSLGITDSLYKFGINKILNFSGHAKKNIYFCHLHKLCLNTKAAKSN